MPAELQELLRSRYTDEWLLAAGAEYGLDLRRRDDVLGAAAVGMTVLLWRNTVLEDIHAGEPGVDATEVRERLGLPADCDDETVGSRLRDRRTMADAVLANLRDVADPAEQVRLDAVIEDIVVGGGIPDDVMLRMNTSTAFDVLEALDSALPDDLDAHTDLPYGRRVIPDWMSAVHATLTDPYRTVAVGCVEVPVVDVFGSHWEDYLEQAMDKTARPLAFCDVLGARRGLWLMALSGAQYAGSWWPHPWTASAVTAFREGVARGLHRPLTDGREHVETDEAFWQAVTTRPWALNGTQAWVLVIAKFHGLEDEVRAEQERRAAALCTELDGDVAHRRFGMLDTTF